MSWSPGSYDDTVRWSEPSHGSDARILHAQPLAVAYDADRGAYYLTPLGVTPDAVLRWDSDTGSYYLSGDTSDAEARFVVKRGGDAVVREERS